MKVYDAASIRNVALVGHSASGKTLSTSDPAPNRKRFLIVGLNQQVISDGAVVLLSVALNPAASGSYPLQLFNLLGEAYAPLLRANLTLLCFWLFVWWLYRQRIFFRI